MLTIAWIHRRRSDCPSTTLVAAQAGDRLALEQLLTPHVGMLRGVCRAQLGHADDAEDALQETLIRACTALRRFRGEARLTTFLVGIAVHVCTDLRRAKNRQPQSLPIDTEFAATVQSPEHTTEQHALILDALATLSPKRRAAFWLKEAEGWSMREIGTALDWPETRVKVELFRARRCLAQWAARYSEEQP